MTPNDFKEIRNSLGLSLSEMAEMLGYETANGAGQVRGMESGKRTIMPAQARLMAAYRDGYRPDDWPGGDYSGLRPEEVIWITNDSAELGVRIGDQCFFLYKGNSLVYEDGVHDDDTPMHIRTVGKREFGECAHPLNRLREGKIGTVSLDDCDRWEKMPEQRKVPS